MTRKDYMKLVGDKLGWAWVPPGSRDVDLHAIPQYEAASKSYGPMTLQSITNATPNKPTVQPVPYTGVQFVGIPEFQDLGTRVSQQITAAIAGQKSVQERARPVAAVRRGRGESYQERVMTRRGARVGPPVRGRSPDGSAGIRGAEDTA